MQTIEAIRKLVNGKQVGYPPSMTWFFQRVSLVLCVACVWVGGRLLGQQTLSGKQQPLQENVRQLHFVMIKYKGGSWDPALSKEDEMEEHVQSYIPNFLRWLNTNSKKFISTDEKVELLWLSDKRIFDYPMLFITGHFDFTLSDKEKQNLKEYLERGGFLYVEDCGGSLALLKRYGRFDVRMKKEIQALFPEGEFKVLPSDHDIYQFPYKFPHGLPNMNGENSDKSPESPTKKRKDHGGEGFYYRDRMMVFHSDTDSCCGWAWNGEDMWGDIPFQIGANVVVYAMTH